MLRTLAKLVAIAALGWVCSAQALGLGEIEIKSRLNQPLSATIQISSATPKELESLNIVLAGNEEFERAGMERPEFLSSLKFEIKDNIIRVTSKDLAREPFVSFLLDVRWTGGRLLREYTVLLDPPTLAQAPKPVLSKAEGPAPRMAESPSESPAMSQESPAPAMSGEPSVVTQPDEPPPMASSPGPAAEPSVAYDGETYGPVQPKETLWSIAYKLRTDPALTMDQMQVAIFNANPKAFEAGRLTGLMKGSVIRIPSADEIRAVDPVSAKAQVAEANRTSGRPVAAAAPPPAPMVKEEPPAESLVKEEPAPPPPSEPAPQAPPTEPSATAPPAGEQAAPPGDQPVAAETSPAPAGDSAPAATEKPVDPSQMVDEPAPAVDTQPAPADVVQTEPLPPPAAAPVAPVEEPGLLDQALGLMDHPLFLPVLGGVVALLILVVLGGKLRNKFAQWSYERASHKKTGPTVQLTAADDTMAAPDEPMAPMMGLEHPDADAATVVREPPAMRGDRSEQDMAATATQAMVAQTQQQTMQQTLQQTHVQTQAQPHAQTQAQEPAAAKTGAPKVDFDVSGTYATETVQINLDAGDPVSEAEFHRAYGLYDEAALLLKQALQKDPARTDARVKLAEIYFEANKANEFVDTAKQLKGQLPDAEWQKIALLGSQIAPGNELFQGATAGGTVDLSFDEPAPAAPAAAPAAKAAPAPAAPAGGGDMLDFTIDDINKLADSPPPPSQPAAAKPAAADEALEFDLGSLSLDAPKPAAPSAPSPAPAKSVPPAALVTGGEDFKMDDLNLGDFDLKADMGAAPSPEPAAAPAPAAAPESIELGGELSLEEAPAAGDESSTKLDLARAYMDMGDNDMAKSLLNEVKQQGSAQQKKEAQELLSRVAA
jgi:FimV-like protein